MKTLSEIRGSLNEFTPQKGGSPDPPMVLVLRRTSIRLFPAGDRVAWYTNENYGIDISVPYNVGKSSRQHVAGVMGEGVLRKLHHIAMSKTPGDVAFKNGAQARIDHRDALQVIRLHSMLTPQNKQKVESLINDNPGGVKKIAAFAKQNLK